MSIGLSINYREPDRDEVYYPIVSTGSKSRYELFWKPLVEENNLEWVTIAYSAGLPLLRYMDRIEAIKRDFDKLAEVTKSSQLIPADYKETMNNRISIIIETLNEITLDSEKFSEVYLG